MPHIHEQYDFTVTAFIVNDANQVLLVNHPRYKMWIPVGGHVELDEDPEVALYREIKEEAGLEVEHLTNKPTFPSVGTKFLAVPDYLDVHEANPPHKHISMTYFVKPKSRDFKLSDEHEAMRWFKYDELDNPQYKLTPAMKFYCQQAIKKFAV